MKAQMHSLFDGPHADGRTAAEGLPLFTSTQKPAPLPIGTLVKEIRPNHAPVVGAIVDFSRISYSDNFRYVVAIQPEVYNAHFGHQTDRAEQIHMYSTDVEVVRS